MDNGILVYGALLMDQATFESKSFNSETKTKKLCAANKTVAYGTLCFLFFGFKEETLIEKY